jgi:hypothetical protein
VRAASPSTPFLPVAPSEVSRRPTRAAVPPIEEVPEPGTYGHIPPPSVTPVSEEPPDGLGEEPRGAPPPGVSRAPTARGAPGEGEVPRGAPELEDRGEIPEPETRGHIRPESLTPTSEEEPGGFPRGVPGPELSRAPTARGVPGVPGVAPRVPSGPGRLDYDDAERERHERFGEIERRLADATQDAAEAEMRREHDFQEREAARDRHFAEKEAGRDRQFDENVARRGDLPSSLARQQPPGGLPVGEPLPGDVLGAPERAESVITDIRRAAAESAARHADDIRDIVQGEREEMARQIQAEREEARAAREALEQQLHGERKRADDEREARVRELKEELARARDELDRERQQRDHDEEMRREAESQRNLERDEETRQQLSEITDLLLAHREEFARKKETVDDRWREKQDWRNETNRQFQDLFNMVQNVMNCCEVAKERCEEERRAAAARHSRPISLPYPPPLCSHFLSHPRRHGRVATITRPLRHINKQ